MASPDASGWGGTDDLAVDHFFVFGIAGAEPLASASAMLSRSLTRDGVIYHV